MESVLSSLNNIQVLAPDTLLEATVLSLTGTSAVSAPYQYQLTLVSDYPYLERLLATTISLQLHIDGTAQYLHGIITDITTHATNNVIQLQIEPPLVNLKQYQHSRVFTHISVPKLVQDILNQYHLQPVDTSALTQEYLALPYITQYQETDFAFIARLLADCGIYYYFVHQQQQTSLHFADRVHATPLLQEAIFSSPQQHRAAPQIFNLATTYAAMPNDINSFYYDTQRAGEFYTQHASVSSYWSLAQSRTLNEDDYNQVASIAGQGEQQLIARQRALLAQSQFTSCQSNTMLLQPGQRFLVAEADCYYLVSASALTLKPQQAFLHELILHNTDQEYATKSAYHKPVITGTQRAKVIGANGERYDSDGNARVKAQFYWDEHATGRMNQTRWMQVMQHVSGNDWGELFLPAVGDDVLVAFLDGDIDQPLIIGSVYQTDQHMKYPLPEHEAITSMSFAAGNELLFNDGPKPSLQLQAVKDLCLHVEYDANTAIARDQTILVKQGDINTSINDGQATFTANQTQQLSSQHASLNINASGITFSAPQVTLNSQGVRSNMQPLQHYINTVQRCIDNQNEVARWQAIPFPVLPVNSADCLFDYHEDD